MWGLEHFSTIFLAASPSTQYNPRSIQDISGDFRELYSILGEGAPVYKKASPTIRFNFVTPPISGKSWLDDDILYSDTELMSDDSDSLFLNVAVKHGENKPIALYLPGLDGFGVSASTWQFDDLSRTFELWRMSVKIEDKTSFGDLLHKVCEFVEDIASVTDRPVYVIGESFGGLLAPAVSLRMQKKYERENRENPLKGLVLINPATSFDESSWDILAPFLTTFGKITDSLQSPAGLPSLYSIVGGLTLSSLIPSSQQNQQILKTILSLDSIRQPNGALTTIQGMLESFRLTGDVLPAALLKHRVSNWMIVGSQVINSRLSELDVPTLVVAGTEDKLIPSGSEIKRLMKTIPNCEKLEVKGAGHFVLDNEVNLTEALIYSKMLDPLNRNSHDAYDPISDWKLPSKELIDEVREQSVKTLNDAFSPIYISSDLNGTREFGMGNLPRDGPLLFVSNHQLLGVDLNMLINEFVENDIVVRGLAHPVIFQSSNDRRVDLEGRVPGLMNRNGSGSGPSTSNFELFGAVMVTPRNYYRVLSSGQNALLFPGGVKEVFHGRDQAYKLLWPEKIDFVRTAARFNATIIPLSAVGMADSLNIILEPSEIASIPILGERAKNFADNVTAARFDMSDNEESFLPPIVAPGLPSRNYFLFGKPIVTSDIDPKDKVACEQLYMQVQDEMKQGFDAILKAREKDPYKDALSRLPFERLTGKKAPTFALSELDIAMHAMQ